jgi:hypothetical protein
MAKPKASVEVEFEFNYLNDQEKTAEFYWFLWQLRTKEDEPTAGRVRDGCSDSRPSLKG